MPIQYLIMENVDNITFQNQINNKSKKMSRMRIPGRCHTKGNEKADRSSKEIAKSNSEKKINNGLRTPRNKATTCVY